MKGPWDPGPCPTLVIPWVCARERPVAGHQDPRLSGMSTPGSSLRPPQGGAHHPGRDCAGSEERPSGEGEKAGEAG